MKNRQSNPHVWTSLASRCGAILVLSAAPGLGACSSGPGSDPTGQSSEALGGARCTARAEIGKSGLYLETTIPLPNLAPGEKFSYDIGAVDARAHRYYLADRTNKSLDIIDTRTFAVRQVAGFAGIGATNDASGPDGVVYVPGGSVYVGDVNGVKVIDPKAGAVVRTISIATSGFRTDEGCFDPDDRIAMFQNPADSPPFSTFISTETNEIVARLPFADASGLDGCVYDRRTKRFLVNNDGTAANPDGEVDVIAAGSVVAGSPAVSARYPLGKCGPAVVALNRHGELAIACDAPAGAPQTTILMDSRNGAIRRTVTQVGGEDEVAFDGRLDRFYVAARDMTANGISQTGLTGAKFTPVLGIIDARTGAWIDSIPTGSGAHSVATDAETGDVFVPVPPTATASGGVQVYAPICADRDDSHGRGRCACEGTRHDRDNGDDSSSDED